jgi:putative transcriptional regulator
MNVSRQTIYPIEQERYIPSQPLALARARFFGSTVEELFNAK